MSSQRDWTTHGKHAPDAPTTVAPSRCPFCGSSAISTAAKRVDASAYWRCGGCGEMWNVGRLNEAKNQSYRRW
jgi:transposase-like protein